MASLSGISTHTHTCARVKMHVFCHFGNRIHKLYILRGVNIGGISQAGGPWGGHFWPIFGLKKRVPEALLKTDFRDGTMERDPVQSQHFWPRGSKG